MTRFTPVLPALIVIILAATPSTSRAQSVDECMSAGQAEALTICQSLIDQGSRNADVYWKLSSSQYQEGQRALAEQTLANAMRLHPGNTKLKTLQSILATDSTEQEMIARSAQLNQTSLDQGALKISCLTKRGSEGISACKRRLELTDIDGDRMRARLAVLEEAQAPEDKPAVAQRPAPTPTVVPTPPTRPVEPVAPVSPIAETPVGRPSTNVPVTETASIPSPSTEQFAEEARKATYKRLVADMQILLNDFGFKAGVPDGVPGSNTRKALAAFYTTLGEPVNTSINDLTLEDLLAEKPGLDRARQLMRQSQRALANGELELAVQHLNSARQSSQLLSVPIELERGIQSGLIKDQNPVSPPVPIANNTPTPATTVSSTPARPATSGSAAEFDALMGRINILQGQIRRQQADYQSKLDQLRAAY